MDISPYLPHLVEFRQRLIRCVIAFLAVFLALFFIDNHLYSFIAKPLLAELPFGSSLIATQVTSTFMVPMKLALILAFFLIIPYILYQIWSFITPGLYKAEKRSIFPYLIASLLLFYSGVTFAYYCICPAALSFFAHCSPANVLVMTDIKDYLDFVLTLLFSGGIAFQVPIITFASLQFGIISAEKLAHFRPYVIVAAFILGMLLTPPDVVSQILLALPIWGLFEVGLFASLFLEKYKIKKRAIPNR